jgi:glucose/arabinose dehydrogenase
MMSFLQVIPRSAFGILIMTAAGAPIGCSKTGRGDNIASGTPASGASAGVGGSDVSGAAGGGGGGAAGAVATGGASAGGRTGGASGGIGGASGDTGGGTGGSFEAGADAAKDSAGAGNTPITDSCSRVPPFALVPAWTADPHFCLIRFADGVDRARQIAFAPNGDLFVATALAQLIVLFDADGDGVSGPAERATFAATPGGNHGLAISATHIYTSSDTAVYRFAYTPGQRAAGGAPETVVREIPPGGHISRTLLLDAQNRLYVSIGSLLNVDVPADPLTPPEDRSQIRRFDLAAIPSGGHPFAAGEVVAKGLRNEVGITFDAHGRLWGVENGRDQLVAGGDAEMYNDNPAEEVNLFDPALLGRSYGYPFCWSEGIWSGPLAKGRGTQHLDPDQPGAFSEQRCQDPDVVVQPVLTMRAHLAPLDIVEYTGAAYPADYRGDLFVTSHGSWNRSDARGQVGRLIIRLRMGANGLPTMAESFLGELGPDGALKEGSWAVYPVSIRTDAGGLLTFSDDAAGTIHKIGYRP